MHICRCEKRFSVAESRGLHRRCKPQPTFILSFQAPIRTPIRHWLPWEKTDAPPAQLLNITGRCLSTYRRNWRAIWLLKSVPKAFLFWWTHEERREEGRQWSYISWRPTPHANSSKCGRSMPGILRAMQKSLRRRGFTVMNLFVKVSQGSRWNIVYTPKIPGLKTIPEQNSTNFFLMR